MDSASVKAVLGEGVDVDLHRDRRGAEEPCHGVVVDEPCGAAGADGGDGAGGEVQEADIAVDSALAEIARRPEGVLAVGTELRQEPGPRSISVFFWVS